MAGLNVAEGTTIYLDANVPVYVVESHYRYRPALEPLLQQAQNSRIQLITSHISVLECLIMPMRGSNHALIEYRQALMASDLVLVPISLEVLIEAASLRAKHLSLRTPDAIHWATMRTQGGGFAADQRPSLCSRYRFRRRVAG
ncbi:MAG: hypothetical protein KatS3mg022_3318 [Armatimonadota bacterium]|nr:MAG: hypothetical protein KatS3mg022_3318 [Armatimonadota bacterium]